MELATLVIASSIVSVTGTVELIAALISSIFVSIFPVATVVACVALALIVTVWMVDMYCSYYDYIYTGNLESYVDTQDKAFQLFILGNFELIMSQFIFAKYAAPYLGKEVVENDSYSIKEGDSNGYNPLENIVYTDKVKEQMTLGDYHSFPEAVEGFGDMGKISTIVGGDGISRTLVEIEGSYMGKDGVFQFIIEPDGVTCNHRIFIPE